MAGLVQSKVVKQKQSATNGTKITRWLQKSQHEIFVAWWMMDGICKDNSEFDDSSQYKQTFTAINELDSRACQRSLLRLPHLPPDSKWTAAWWIFLLPVQLSLYLIVVAPATRKWTNHEKSSIMSLHHRQKGEREISTPLPAQHGSVALDHPLVRRRVAGEKSTKKGVMG